MPTVTLSQLGRAFGRFKAVDGIDLEIRDGEFLSLLGPSGCGKTTTLRMLAGFVDPTEGTIAVDGRMLSSPKGSVPPEKRGMSMIFQSYAIWPNMTVAENVAFGLKLRKLPAAEIKRRLGDVLDVVQMGALSNLDANLREEMRFEIRRLHEALRITTVYVTHDQAEAMVTSDRVAVMNKGRIEQVDVPYMVYSRPKTRFVAGFIGRTNFIAACRNGSTVAFDGFAIDTGRFDDMGGAAAGEALTFSVRPQSLQLSREPLQDGKRISVKGSIVQRSFLGEHWDYVFGPESSALRLKVATQPSEVHDVGSTAWLCIDPKLMVAIN
jgi:ABC-type Fe3+/spermidine/putrescine transport system ATPase subunit